MNCMFYGDGWQVGEASLCFADGEYHEFDDFCDFFDPRRSKVKACGLRPCDKFKGMATNGDVCAWLLTSKRCAHPDFPLAKCPWEGQRVSRPYEKMDTEEDSFE